jgi:hypothetical protein
MRQCTLSHPWAIQYALPERPILPFSCLPEGRLRLATTAIHDMYCSWPQTCVCERLQVHAGHQSSGRKPLRVRAGHASGRTAATLVNAVTENVTESSNKGSSSGGTAFGTPRVDWSVPCACRRIRLVGLSRMVCEVWPTYTKTSIEPLLASNRHQNFSWFSAAPLGGSLV